MTLTAIVGALMALVPGAARRTMDKTHPRFIAGYDAGVKDGRLQARDENVEIGRLAWSHARLADHIKTLEREILIEQHLCAHWKEAAQRWAREAREERERQQKAALQHQAANLLQAALQQQAQAQAQALAQQQAANPLAQQHQAYAGFCNCVPARSQLWGAG